MARTKQQRPIDKAAILRMIKYPLTATQIGKRLGYSSGSVSVVIERHLSDLIDSEVRTGPSGRPERHYWRKETTTV